MHGGHILLCLFLLGLAQAAHLVVLFLWAGWVLRQVHVLHHWGLVSFFILPKLHVHRVFAVSIRILVVLLGMSPSMMVWRGGQVARVLATIWRASLIVGCLAISR